MVFIKFNAGGIKLEKAVRNIEGKSAIRFSIRIQKKRQQKRFVVAYEVGLKIYLITAFIFSQSALSKPESAKLGFAGSEASPIRITTIFLLGIT